MTDQQLENYKKFMNSEVKIHVPVLFTK